MTLVSESSLAKLRLTLSGHLTGAALETQLSSVAERLAGAKAREPLLVDCSTMTGYEPEARELFINWNRKHSPKLSRVAVVTEKPMWHLVVSVMALVAGQQIKAFNTHAAAETWLAEA